MCINSSNINVKAETSGYDHNSSNAVVINASESVKRDYSGRHPLMWIEIYITTVFNCVYLLHFAKKNIAFKGVLCEEEYELEKARTPYLLLYRFFKLMYLITS
jgi:hypothetical protein